MTLPLLVNDGRPLHADLHGSIATTSYPDGADSENFININPKAPLKAEGTLRSTYGDLEALRAMPMEGTSRVFVYPRTRDGLPATSIQRTFHRTADGFTSVLGEVHGQTFVSQTVAGGVARSLTLPGGKRPAVQFDIACGFLAHLQSGRVTEIETDADVQLMVDGSTYTVARHQPFTVPVH